MFSVFVVSLVLFSRQTGALFEGDPCTVPATAETGQCTQLDKCEYAKQLLRSNKNPQSCGFQGKAPLVCCPVGPKPGDTSLRQCDRYFNRKYQYYAIDLGEKARSKEFPHMAAVGYGDDKSNIFWLCGGTLISQNFVLSAAHCAESQDFGAAKWIRLGDLDLQNATEDANPQDVRIVQTYVHPGYRSSSHYHDIALFKMAEKVIFTIYFKAACLHVGKSLPVNTLQATGWGKMGFFGDPSSHLMKVNLSLVNHDTCSKRYANVANSRKLKNGIFDDYQMCAGNVEGGDTCPGDSGGPLHYTVQPTNDHVFHFTVAGVTSFGKGCGGDNTVGVYTRVSGYVGWIEDIVWKEDN
ncbi:hypothetical protein Zmor_015729 [Zophobas morio]|uniref:Uncharacterized protein n=1 Tax=Zophobas morio TaxID=2755281 RepID=A0AA38IKR4_9CUCU|nr:hypothetical protein Zmor_015729 [Zophobas morio]